MNQVIKVEKTWSSQQEVFVGRCGILITRQLARVADWTHFLTQSERGETHLVGRPHEADDGSLVGVL